MLNAFYIDYIELFNIIQFNKHLFIRTNFVKIFEVQDKKNPWADNIINASNIAEQYILRKTLFFI